MSQLQVADVRRVTPSGNRNDMVYCWGEGVGVFEREVHGLPTDTANRLCRQDLLPGVLIGSTIARCPVGSFRRPPSGLIHTPPLSQAVLFTVNAGWGVFNPPILTKKGALLRTPAASVVFFMLYITMKKSAIQCCLLFRNKNSLLLSKCPYGPVL